MSELLTGYRLSDFTELKPDTLEEASDAWDQAGEEDPSAEDDAAQQMSMLIDIDLTFLQSGGELPPAEVPLSRSVWLQPSTQH